MANSNNNIRKAVIKVGYGSLAFDVTEKDGQQTSYRYALKANMSVAANLREAFKEEHYLHQQLDEATLVVDTPVVLMPQEEYDAEKLDIETLFASVMTGRKGEEKMVSKIPELGCVALYPVNVDLKTVVYDRCNHLEVENFMVPVWKDYYARYYEKGKQRRLFAYFHDKTMDVFAFGQRRLQFANHFDATHAHDALYYMLFVWKQLGMNQQEDELFIIGEPNHKDWLMTRLKTYVANINQIEGV